MKVSVGVSNRHVHLCEEDYQLLFGDEELVKKSDLKQTGEFASMQLVTIKGPKGEINNVRVLGPLRKYTQVEVSRTDSYKLGVLPPVRTSGDLGDASPITIIGPKGEIERNACIIANRHIHIDEELRQKYGLVDVKEVSVRVDHPEKGGILEHVYLKDTPNAFFEIHVDTDDANAFLLKQDGEVEIIL